MHPPHFALLVFASNRVHNVVIHIAAFNNATVGAVSSTDTGIIGGIAAIFTNVSGLALTFACEGAAIAVPRTRVGARPLVTVVAGEPSPTKASRLMQ